MKKFVKIGLGVGIGALAAAGIAALVKHVADASDQQCLNSLDEDGEWINQCDDGFDDYDYGDMPADAVAEAKRVAAEVGETTVKTDIDEDEAEIADDACITDEDDFDDEDSTVEDNMTGFDSEFEVCGSRLCSVDGEKHEPVVSESVDTDGNVKE